jgi:hypothetical protein
MNSIPQIFDCNYWHVPERPKDFVREMKPKAEESNLKLHAKLPLLNRLLRVHNKGCTQSQTLAAQIYQASALIEWDGS